MRPGTTDRLFAALIAALFIAAPIAAALGVANGALTHHSKGDHA